MVRSIRLEESEIERGWLFVGSLERDGSARPLQMTLSWPDYEYWGRGLVRPVEVAQALLRVLSESEIGTQELPERFDASRLRRLITGFDGLVRQSLGFEELGGRG